MAINKQAIIEAVYPGRRRRSPRTRSRRPCGPTTTTSVDDPYDPEAAKKALEDAGVKDLKMKIWAMPVQRPYNPNARRMAELIQADFAKVGVSVEIVSYEWAEYLKLSKEKNRDGAVLLGWTGDNGDPDNFLAVLLGCDAVGGNNRAQWCNKEFEDLIQKAKTLPNNDAARAALQAGAGRLQARGAVGDHRAFGRLHADVQEGQRTSRWTRLAPSASTASTSPNSPA